MNPERKNQVATLLGSYWNLRWLWLTTSIAFGALGLVYVLFLKGDSWVSSQGLIVRDEATGAVMRLGRFESQTAMKEAQETILEMAKNTQVLRDAIVAVSEEDPKWFRLKGKEPSTKVIQSLADNSVVVRAPRGAALGTTEMIYLDVKATSKERSKRLNLAVGDALVNRLQQVRESRANGVIQELTAARAAARENLAEATQRLQEIESAVGEDLSDLRTLSENASNSSTTRLELDRIAKELRDAEVSLRQIEADLATAKASLDNPENLLQTPTKLVNSHPGLKRLREGLATASIESSELISKYTAAHPLVIAARNTEVQIREELRNELGISIRTLTKDQEIMSTRIANLNKQKVEYQERLARLATVRAGYSNIVGEVRARNEQLQDAERDLAAAIAARDAAMNSSLITRIDEPVLGESPAGPGRFTILAGVTMSGLFFGFGIVFLLTPLDANTNFGRRSQDYAGNQDRRRGGDSTRQPLADEAATAPVQPAPPVRPNPPQPVAHPGAPKPVSISAAIAKEKKNLADDANQLPAPLAAPQPAKKSPPAARPPAKSVEVPSSENGLVVEKASQGTASKKPTNNSALESTTRSSSDMKPGEETPALSPAEAKAAEDAALAEAQAVIAAALQCSFAEEANAPAKPSNGI